MNVRTTLHRPYFFEVFAVANLLFIQLLLLPVTPAVIRSLPQDALMLTPVFLAELATGVIVRLVVGLFDGTARDYLRTLATPAWIADTIRLIVFAVVTTHTYAWIKLMIPFIHPHLFDQQLWNFETSLLGGYSPSVFVLTLFANPRLIGLIDWTYGPVFILTMNIAYAFFLSSPSRRLRVVFTNSNAVLWLAGAWLYVALPTLGPAYAFPAPWARYAPWLPDARMLQLTLLNNYRLVLSRSAPGTVNVLLGIAAFPSLHVAFAVFVLLWMRSMQWMPRIRRGGQIVFAICATIIFIGSVVTGWHYVTDSVAGIVLAWAAWAIFVKARRFRHWIALRCAAVTQSAR